MLDYNKQIRNALSKSIIKIDSLKNEKQQLQLERDIEQKKVKQLEKANEEFQKLISEQRNEQVELIERQLTSEDTRFGKGKIGGKLGKKNSIQLLKLIRGIKNEKDQLVSDLSITKINMRKQLKRSVTEMNTKLGQINEKFIKSQKEKAELEKIKIQLELEVDQ